MSSTKVQWRVQVRKSRAHKWVNKGLFETRAEARWRALCLSTQMAAADRTIAAYGTFTRVVRYEKGAQARVRAM